MMSYYQRDFILHKFGIKYGDIMHKSNVSRRLTLLFYYATLSKVKFMDKDSEKNSANSDDEIIEKELSEMDVKKIMIFRQIGAKIAYYRTLRQMTQAELAKRANLSKGSIGRIERGKYNKGVPISTLLDIAEGLRIELASLVTFSEEEKKVWWEIDKHML